MRTSRVSATPSSVFRNEQQYLQAGDISHKFHKNMKKESKRKNVPDKQLAADNREQTYLQRTLGDHKEVYFDDENDLQMRHNMNETASKLSRINKQQKRLNSYRSSI